MRTTAKSTYRRVTLRRSESFFDKTKCNGAVFAAFDDFKSEPSGNVTVHPTGVHRSRSKIFVARLNYAETDGAVFAAFDDFKSEPSEFVTAAVFFHDDAEFRDAHGFTDNFG